MRWLLLLAACLVALGVKTALANPAHDRIARMSDRERNVFLTTLLKAGGESCDLVTRNFFQGKDKSDNAFWNVACLNGKVYVIVVNNDSAGSTKVTSCALLKALDVGQCFKKF